MQDHLWGEEECIPLQRKPRSTMQAYQESEQQTGTPLSTCVYYGHTWEYYGFIGLKKCTVCGEKGYCPLCTPHPPLMSAKPFYCTTHTPLHEESEAQ
jgi:hypothetical protein